MPKLKKITREYLTFSKKERNAGIALSLAIVMVLITPIVHRQFLSSQPRINADSLQLLLAVISVEDTDMNLENDDNYYHKKKTSYYSKYQPYSKNNKWENDDRQEIILFPFDPNLISRDEWLQLGIKDFIVTRIMNYRDKGGRYRKKEDLLKTYGFLEKDYLRLKDYIIIDSIPSGDKTIYTNTAIEIKRLPTDINSATLQQIKDLGFNSYTADKIIKLRDGLGGLYSTEQLKGIYNIDTAVLYASIPFIIADVNTIKTININTCSMETLAAHTYITHELAQAIIDYRKTTGKFYSLTELMKVKGMYKALFEKLKPYLYL